MLEYRNTLPVMDEDFYPQTFSRTVLLQHQRGRKDARTGKNPRNIVRATQMSKLELFLANLLTRFKNSWETQLRNFTSELSGTADDQGSRNVQAAVPCNLQRYSLVEDSVHQLGGRAGTRSKFLQIMIVIFDGEQRIVIRWEKHVVLVPVD